MTGGYKVKDCGHSVKRYCQTLDLKDGQNLTHEYMKHHSKKESWPEIREDIRDVWCI